MNNTEIQFRDYTVRQKVAEYTILFLLSASFLLIFSLWTSPYYRDWYGCDASFFTLVGRGITEGKVMYRDFYDLKGPYFFFLQAIGQYIVKGRLGIFLIQLPALYSSVILIWNISLLFVNKAKSSFILFVFFICHITTLWGGNTLEEFILPMSLLSLYLVCRLYKSSSVHETFDFASKVTIPNSFAMMLGLFLGIIVFSKISVCGTVLGIIAAIIYIMGVNKKWSDLFIFILYVILGFSLSVIPVIIYFTYNGCLGDMLKCVFILGFRRSKDYAELFNIKWELKCLGAIFALVFAATHMKRSRKSLCVILLSVSAATYILFHLGTPFYYYFTSAYPCLILALALFLEAYDPLLLFESAKQGVCIALFSAFLLYYVPVSFNTIQTAMYDRYNESYSEYKKNSQDLVSFIPSFERNQVFSFLIDMQFYEINDMMPCNKYVVNLPFFIALDENVMPELQTMMNEAPPKWIVSGDCLDLNIPEMYEILDSKYSLIYENEVGKLYILN